MRIIAGDKRGFKLKTLKGLEVRPTLEQVKECIFNMIQAEIAGAVTADFFCGSGNLGLEALSRGASRCTFIDSSRDSLKIVKENILAIGYESRTEVLKLSLPDELTRFADRMTVDIVFADPPYGTPLASKLLERIAKEKLLKPGCLIIVEHSGKMKVSFSSSDFKMLREKKFGQSAVFILRRT